MRTLKLKESDVEKIEYIFKENHNFYTITLVSRGNFCPRCHTFSNKIHSYKNKYIKHSILIKEDITIIYHQRRYICPQCKKTFIEKNLFSFNSFNCSNATIEKTLLLLKDYNQTFSSVSHLVNLSVTEVIEIFDSFVQIDRKPLQEVICIDEFYFSRHSKNKYSCLLVGFKNGLLLDVLVSRKKSYLKNYFRQIPKSEREIVKFISMDMYETYRDVAQIYFPNAICCADSFHVVKNINDALNNIRCKVMNRYKDNKSSDEYYLLKYHKYLLFKDSLKISDEKFKYNKHFHYSLSEGAMLEKILDIDKELKYAYELKELYMIFNESKGNRNEIANELDTIINSYKISGITQFENVGNTLLNWRQEIINSFYTYEGRRINNGPIEGRNKYVKIILALANGYRNFKRFRNRILYIFNKHEKPLQKPKDTRLIKLPGKERGKYKK
jgi:transposase